LEAVVITQFNAKANLRTAQIDLEWTWQDPGARPGIRVVRQRRAYPQTVADGVTLFALAEHFQSTDTLWAAIERTTYTIPDQSCTDQSCTDQSCTDQSCTKQSDRDVLQQGEVSFFYTDENSAIPARCVVRIYDSATDALQQVVINELSRVVRAEESTAEWDAVVSLQLFSTPGGGAETFAGILVVSTDHTDGVTPKQLLWNDNNGTMFSTVFDQFAAQYTSGELFIQDQGHIEGTLQTISAQEALQIVPLPTAAHDLLVATAASAAIEVHQVVTIHESFDIASGDWQRSVQLHDRARLPEVPYYYTLFLPDAADPSAYVTERTWRAMAVATAAYGMSERLYGLLPALYQQYDEPTANDNGRGQLRRYLQLFGAALDTTRSQQEGLQERHNVDRARADLLPHLARWIGWELDQTLDERVQRSDIRYAPELFSTVGTLPNLQALVTRVTGWECRAKEFVHNVFLTNAVESIQLWELWTSTHDGVEWSMPTQVTQTDALDGHPALTLAADNTPWLFWHANRLHDGRDRREIWLQRLAGVDAEPQPALPHATEAPADALYADEAPTAVTVNSDIWLFWQSNRDGAWEIYSRIYQGLPGEEVVRLTVHPAADRYPAAVRGRNNSIWLVWQSDRRGPTDIWLQVHTGTNWSLPARLTTATSRDEMPAVAVDGNDQLWLFWSVDLGDRRKLFVRIRNNSDPTQPLLDGWSPAEALTTGPWRDEAPRAQVHNGQLWLFWHSNRSGFWQIWTMQHDGGAWRDPVPVTAEVTGDKEPAVLVDSNGDLRLFWRSQRRGRHYQSRTVDTNDPEMLDQLQTFADRSHYTYETGTGDADWYARGTVGLYLAPDINDTTAITNRVSQARNFVEPFRPAPARFVWLRETDGV